VEPADVSVGSSYCVHCLQLTSDSARVRDFPVQVQTAKVVGMEGMRFLLFLGLFLIRVDVVATSSAT